MPKNNAKDAPLSAMQPLSVLAPMIGPQIEHFWKMQDRLLDESQTFTQHWFERRHEAVRTALETARNVSGAAISNPMTAMTLMSDWQKHSSERLAEDAREWFETMSRCADFVIKTETETFDETMSEASKLTAKVTKSAKSEPV